MQLFREHTPAWMHSLVIWNKVHPCYLHRLRNTKWPPGIVQIATVSTLTWHPAMNLHLLLCPHAKPEFPTPCTSWGTSFQKVLSEADSPATPLTWGWQKVSLLDLHLQSGMIKDHQGSFQCVCVCACARAESAFFGLDPLDSNTLRIEAFDKLNPGHTSWS